MIGTAIQTVMTFVDARQGFDNNRIHLIATFKDSIVKHLTLAILLSTGLLAGGCSSFGNPSLKHLDAPAVDAKIYKGVTTKREVRERFGDPLSVSFTDSGNELWHYRLTESHATALSFVPIVRLFSSGTESNTKGLAVFFDQSGRVQNYAFNNSRLDAKHGIVRQ